MEMFSYTSSDMCENSQAWNTEPTEFSEFDKKLCSSWDKAMEDGHFRYKLDIEETRIIGEKGYVAQLNIKRAQERRKPDNITTVNQPFNPASFNFTKIKPAEILFEMIKDKSSCTNYQKEQNGHDQECNGDVSKVRNQVIINVSPLEHGHVLLVPDIDACRPQILTEKAIQLSLEMMLLSKNRGFRVGFNSLCAFASVNHQHLHAFYLDRELFVESSLQARPTEEHVKAYNILDIVRKAVTPVDHICGDLYELVSMPTKGFAFQLHGSTYKQMSRTLFLVADYFQKNEIAHNLYMTRGPVFGEAADSVNRTIRAYMWPRKKFIGLKDEAAFNVAIVELAGHLPIKIWEMFHDLDETMIEDTIREAALEDAEYANIKQDLMKICVPSSS